jgi:iron complex transport system substrate-binding protein
MVAIRSNVITRSRITQVRKPEPLLSVTAVSDYALIGTLVAALVVGCGSPNPPAAAPAARTHVVVDSTGTPVTVPTVVNRIADAWPAHNEVVQMLGAGDKIVATVLTPSSVPWLYAIDPALKQAQTVFTTSTVDTEQLLADRPDVLFTDKGTSIAAQTETSGIPTVQLGFQTYPDLEKIVTTTAAVLGAPAQARAHAYNSYLDATLAKVIAVTSKVPPAARPTVLHIYSLNPLVVDGTNTIIDAWITAAGGRNAAQIAGQTRSVSIEQVARWNPDIIILASSAFVANDTGAQTLVNLRSDPFWSKLPAVRNNRAVLNPTGGWHWDRYGIEEALQIQWAAKTLHPDLFTTLDMVTQTKNFYSQFLRYALTDEQVNRMLAAQNPT